QAPLDLAALRELFRQLKSAGEIAFDRGIARRAQRTGVVDGEPVLGAAKASQRIVLLESKADGIDQPMASGTGGVRGVRSKALACGRVRSGIRCGDHDVRRRWRKGFAQ